MIDLGNTCLYSVIGLPDPAYAERVMRVLRYCQKMFKFEYTYLFTVIDVGKQDDCMVVQVPPMDFRSWNIFQHRTMPHFFYDFGHQFKVDEDGFPLDASLWNPEFMDYDYIAPPWGDGLTGSGGFCLTTLRFMLAATIDAPWFDGVRNGDEWLCRELRDWMESIGVKFSPQEVAVKFATETTWNDQPSFGFHGRTHCPEKYKLGWQKIEESEK